MSQYRTQDYKICVDTKIIKPTNKRYSTYYHEVYTAGDVEQYQEKVKKKSLVKKVNVSQDNLFSGNTLFKPWSGYSNINANDVTNTFKYLFNDLKKGIFLQINNNKLETYIPFSNKKYNNDWSHLIKVDPARWTSIQHFLDYASSLKKYKSTKHIPVNEWYSNNGLVRYEKPFREDGHNVATLFDMYSTLCNERDLPDVEFFHNRRDFPLITRDHTEPYNNIHGSKNIKKKYQRQHAPVFSSSISERFADVLVPTYEDWSRVLHQEKNTYIKHSCRQYPIIQESPWRNKIRKCVFRGSTTGVGFNSETNKRLKAYEIGKENTTLLDIGITNWNLRVRKHESNEYLQTIEMKEYKLSNRLSPQEQSQYAYILNIEGHVSAYRLSYEMSFGSVVLIVGSEWHMWFQRFMLPWVHYVPVKEDLSDLVSIVEWCKEHDQECEIIAQNGLEFYHKYLNYESILDYLQKIIIELSQIVGTYSYIDDMLTYQIAEEHTMLKNIHENIDWIQNHPIPKGPINAPRSGVSFMAKWFYFHSRLQVQNRAKIVYNTNRKISRVNVGSEVIVEKQLREPNNQEHIREQIHESFIGLCALNKLNSPNFIYTYGPKNIDDFSSIYNEYVFGVTMREWMDSPNFSFDLLWFILIQINLALITAQNCCGFVHCDLAPHNIILIATKTPITLTYQVKPDLYLKITSSLIPVIIDFEKSKAVVYNPEFGGMKEYGIKNLYKTTKILDTMTLLTTCLSLRSDPVVLKNFKDFFEDIGIPDYMNKITYYSKYGKCFDITNEKGYNPLHFINYMITHFNIKYVKRGELVHEVKQSPLVLFFSSIYGNEQEALSQTLKYISLRTLPHFNVDIEKILVHRLMDKYTGWIDSLIKKHTNSKLPMQWENIKKLIYEDREQPRSARYNISLPAVLPIPYFEDINSPEELNKLSPPLIKGDYIGIIQTYNEMVALNIMRPEILESLTAIKSGYDLLSTIALGNTIVWMKNTLV